MRLESLERTHGLIQRLRFFVISTLLGQVPGPFLVLLNRRNVAGKHLTRCYQEGLRGAGEWTVGEIELFAAFVSSLNRCRF